MKNIGLIPARAGSKRIPGKNMAILNGKPLVQYAVESAITSCMFERIVVTTDWDEVSGLVWNKWFNVDVLLRPDELCTDTAHDYQWVKHALDNYPGFDSFAILRPTNPFRTADTIRNAYQVFDRFCDSVRAVEPTKHHPYKSWIQTRGFIRPFKSYFIGDVASFDLPTQALPQIYCQNACIQIAHTAVPKIHGNVTGNHVIPYFTRGIEGFDINTPDDLAYADWIMRGKP